MYKKYIVFLLFLDVFFPHVFVSVWWHVFVSFELCKVLCFLLGNLFLIVMMITMAHSKACVVSELIDITSDWLLECEHLHDAGGATAVGQMRHICLICCFFHSSNDW